MSNLKLGDWSIFDPGYTPAPGDLGTADILGTIYQTVILPDGMEWMAANLADVDEGGVWWNGGGADDGDGGYYLRTEALAIEALLDNGWRLPTIAECRSLQTLLGGESVAGGPLKTVGTTYWDSPNTGATDEYGFALRGAGFFWSTGSGWTAKKQEGYWWTADTEIDGGVTICVCGALYNSAQLLVGGASNPSVYRFPIRLVRPGPTPIPPSTTSATHDLLILPNGRAETTESLAQRVDIRLRTFAREHWLNPELGVPWFEEFLRKSPDLAACRQILVAVLQDVPGVEEVQSLTVDFAKSSRQMRVSFSVSGTDSIPQSGATVVPL